MTAAHPLVSVLMPVRNAMPWLREAVDSILQQRGVDYELIAVDDGSTDGSEGLLDEYARTSPQVRVIHQPAQGIVAALNTGLHLARGRYVARMDADDIALPDRLVIQTQWMQAHPGVAAAGAAMEELTPSGAIIPPLKVLALDADQVRTHLRLGNCLNHPTVIFDRLMVIDSGSYRAAFQQAEDYDLWLRLSEKHPVHVMPNCVLRYRVHNQQTGHRMIESQTLSALAAQVSATARRQGLPDPADGWSRPVSAANLASAGVSQENLDQSIVQNGFGLIQRYHQLRMKAEARQAHQALGTWIAEASHREAHRAEWLWWASRFQFLDGRPIAGLTRLCRALLRSPHLLARTLRLPTRSCPPSTELCLV